MNQKFCGDSRDLFKYDLIYTIMKKLPELASFTFIPMLTPVYQTKTMKAGQDNEKLIKLFSPFSGENGAELYFHEIQHLFESEGIKTTILNNNQFTRKGRIEYFEKIIENLPENSLIFFDPDTGLREKNPTEEHMKFSELLEVYKKSSPSSLLMVYQHYPRVCTSEERTNFPSKKSQEIGEFIQKVPVTISDGGILFFFLTKNSNLQKKLETVLEVYSKKYEMFFA